MKFFDLLILDVDGVLTDGKKTYDVDGNVISKTFYDRDFTAIKEFKAVGVEVIWLSGDRQVNEGVAKKRGIDFYCSRDVDDKVDFLPLFEEKYGVSRDRMAYVGDDIFDLNIMKEVGYPIAPYQSHWKLKDVSTGITKIRANIFKEDTMIFLSKPGCGFIAALFELWKICGGDSPTLEQIKALDNKEPSTQEMK